MAATPRDMGPAACTMTSTRVLGPFTEKAVYGLAAAGDQVVFVTVADPTP